MATGVWCQNQEPAGRPSLGDKWGVRIERVKLTAAGHMLDFRYRVIDAEKARPLFLRKAKPYLIDETTGARLDVPRTPKIGPLRSTYEPETGRIYWMFFTNPGTLKPGSKVTVVIGDFKAENLTVE